MTKPRPVGRPPRSGKPSLDRIELRVTAAERKAWERASGSLSLSEWIRALCNAASAK